jgi:hypothetical protein
MIPGRIEGANCVYKLEGCHDLPVRVIKTEHGQCLISAWQPSLEEMEALLAGASVVLYIYATGQPPVAVGVSK